MARNSQYQNFRNFSYSQGFFMNNKAIFFSLGYLKNKILHSKNRKQKEKDRCIVSNLFPLTL